MSRELSADLEQLVSFIKNYNLESLAEDKAILPIISKIHKKYFSLLALLVELNSEDIKNNGFNNNDDCKNYLFESLSDLGNSFFLTFNGGYKASRLMLRSSIETFVKGISVEQLPNITSEKRVFKIFEEASKISLFSNEPLKSCFDDIKKQYSDLCEDTHTARKSNMQHISALNYFPTQDIASARKVSDIFVSLTQSYIFIISMKFNQEFHQIHHANKSNIIKSIKRSNRPVVLNVL
ncbi:hypothetical protein HJP15_21550 [Pseudoalteromonas sp. NEC-BIFX-2020_002]|uniref:Orphan protein n=1 Tax=Pseudoalteromonas translucida (strain TAC 125) TaxID=326442 RepID=Q3IGR3_PSET1|nr:MULTISPECIES: hypothetical protein [Pseudoalteromonas]NNG45464.1 hypothetical protein [Pseudoalteromonas sp. NEC-BIFX-2020_002]CAI86670.1 putative orphan protein [Pseudoalteromonas translucida]